MVAVVVMVVAVVALVMVQNQNHRAGDAKGAGGIKEVAEGKKEDGEGTLPCQ